MITVTRELLDLFRRHRIVHGERWRVGERLYVAEDCELEPYCHFFGASVLPARMGAFSYANGRLLPNTRVGRYCSIGNGVEIVQDTHPADWATSSPVFYGTETFQGAMDYLFADRRVSGFVKRRFDYHTGPLVLGHDVWVGQGAMFTAGVAVGDGAIVAARAVVTKDVEPYTIVGGAPARVIRKRFPDRLCERLQASRWWRFGPDVLQPLDVSDPEGFVSRFEDQLGDAEPPALPVPPLTWRDMQATQPSAPAGPAASDRG